ncbi:NADH-quinone oxidoreductase subunit NuoF [Chloracidobacterium aggregatum]|uniref:NADH-quinone oxidoreductase subunit NuoF n=1 Tax=Chloracidobacterium aggregatum TaxID=2851959 RepID=UPI001B8AAE6C|nr:NADH-quinone oxidoreductase subunit NuoF [Chloracidobacterium aggregatum]QUV84387.1 NADH-quinone oxidoreductase subunit NuoF [Chloracidobacterium sp. 2]QUV90031.1 NADH-quinone oxidoreductase subunit NuoF [Chloracidobacterium sp. A]
MQTKLLTRRFDTPNSRSIATYLADGGYAGLKKALTGMQPAEVIEEVKKSSLRGRGGAGFPTGMKWGFVPVNSPKPKYVVCNADESEPGTCKDRELMEKDPHQLIEGLLIAAYALLSKQVFIYIRGEYWYLIAILEQAIAEAREHGFIGKNICGTSFECEIVVHPGAGAYICGEETALLNSLEGYRGHPRIKPPFPAVAGLYGCPTVVNNVETFCAVPHIIVHGGDWYRSLGTEKSGGTKIFSVSGHVNRPGNYEVRMGYPLKQLIEEDCGGIRGGRKLKAVIPGGSSVPIMTAEEVEQATLDYEGMVKAGSMLGSGGVIVMDETTDVFMTTYNLIHFYNHESCGWCTPCREGTDWLLKLFKKIARGEGTTADLDTIRRLCPNIEGRSHCPLGDAAVWPITSAMKKFPEDFLKHVKPATAVPSAA